MTLSTPMRRRKPKLGRLAVAEKWGLRICQLPFLSCVERNHEQGVRLSLALRIGDDQTVAFRTPGNGLRNDFGGLAYPYLGQFAVRPAQRRDQPQFASARMKIKA